MENYNEPPSINSMDSERAIEWIMEAYGEDLKRFIYTYVKNRSQTDDLFQEVLITVYQKLNSFEQRSSLKTWLYRIAANKCKDYLRSPVHRLLLWTDKLWGQTETQSPEQASLIDEQTKQVIDSIMRLPIKYREVLVLQHYKEFTIQEISELLNVNPSTVRTRIMRAKEKLKQELKEAFFL